MPGVSNSGDGSPQIEAPAAGEPLPEEFRDADLERHAELLRRRGWTGACGHADDTEAHPS